MIYLFRTVTDGGRSRLRPMPHQMDPTGKGVITDLNVQANTAIRSAYQRLRTARGWKIVLYSVNTLVFLSVIGTLLLELRILFYR